MCTQAGSDVTLETILCVELHRFKVLDVFGFEEHPAGSTLLLVAFQRVTGQDDPLEDHL